MIDPVFSLVFPTRCFSCDLPIKGLTRVPVCDACWDSVRPYTGVECKRCGLYLENESPLHGTGCCGLCRREAFVFQQARSFGWYEGALRKLVQGFKYNTMLPLARPLAEYLRTALLRMEETRFDLILPVPLHRNRERARGFNQARVLAAQLSKLCGVPIGEKDCVRVRDTKPQTGLRAAARRRNVAGAFAVPRMERVRRKKVLLVDDVLTTGATLNACARALTDAQAAGVWALTIARARPASADVV